MIEPAVFRDVPAMIEVLRWAHGKAPFSAEFDEREANRALCQSIQRNGFTSPSGTWVRVARNADGDITGFIVGVLQPVYHCSKELTAIDLWWVAKQECTARDFVGLMLSMVDWAEKHPKAVEIQSVPDDFCGRGAKAAAALEKLGFTLSGNVYRREA